MGFWPYLFIIFIKVLDLEMVDTKRSFYLQKVLYIKKTKHQLTTNVIFKIDQTSPWQHVKPVKYLHGRRKRMTANASRSSCKVQFALNIATSVHTLSQQFGASCTGAAVDVRRPRLGLLLT